MFRYFCFLVIPVIFACSMSQQSHACEAMDFFIIEESQNSVSQETIPFDPCHDQNESHFSEVDGDDRTQEPQPESIETEGAPASPESFTRMRRNRAIARPLFQTLS